MHPRLTSVLGSPRLASALLALTVAGTLATAAPSWADVPADPQAATAAAPTVAKPAAPLSCGPGNTVKARVVALDQLFWLNRLGTSQPGGMIFALERDVVPTGSTPKLKAGAVKLRDSKRPRPLVLRVNQGDCL
jgi:hypothetical protein